jgi:hypothetical protein
VPLFILLLFPLFILLPATRGMVDVVSLSFLGTAANKNDDLVSILPEINPTTWAIINFVFV